MNALYGEDIYRFIIDEEAKEFLLFVKHNRSLNFLRRVPFSEFFAEYAYRD